MAWPSDEDHLEILVSGDPDDYEIAADWPPQPEPKKTQRDPSLLYLIVRPKWKFHKTDVDPWPSVLHGHHSELPFKLDAITGEVFNIHTRECIQKLRAKELARIQDQLLASKDFKDRAALLFGLRDELSGC